MLSGLRALVVEDDPSIARLLELELRHRGMSVQVAADGGAGLAQAEQRRHDVILLDILLPVLDGERVISYVRRVGLECKVMFISGW
jgi:DNA-binding response OmpR family regulator